MIEFKRSMVAAADRDQVTGYCINLVEFHEETRRLCETENVVAVPVLALTEGELRFAQSAPTGFHNPPWDDGMRTPLAGDASSLYDALRAALGALVLDPRCGHLTPRAARRQRDRGVTPRQWS